MMQVNPFLFARRISLLLVVVSLASSVPNSPCPHLFNYQFDGSEWIGVIQLDNVKVGQTVHLNLKLTVPALLSSSYIGRLDLLDGRQQAIQAVFQRRPLRYRIKFPLQNPLPSLTEIRVDNAVLCSGPAGSSPQMTRIQLYHTFYTKAFGGSNIIGEPSYVPSEYPSPFDTSSQQSLEIPYIPLDLRPQPVENPFVARDPETSESPFVALQPRPQTSENTFVPLQPRPQISEYPFVPRPQPADKPFVVRDPRPQISENSFVALEPGRQPSNRPPLDFTNTPPIHRPHIATSSPASANVTCGQPVSQLTQFVVGGDATKKREWPWLAAVFINSGGIRTFQCGGTLLTAKLTITAAHCIFKDGQKDPVAPNEVFIALGRYNINNWADAGSEFLPAGEISLPPDFVRSDTFADDIAVLVHRRALSFTEYPHIRPICMWSGSSNTLEIEGRMGTVVGWGKDELGNEVSPEPKKIEVGIVSRKTCIKGNSKLEAVTANTNFCAGERNGRGPCTGDSGSGLVIFNNGHWELRGVVAGTVQGGVTKTDQLCQLDEYVVYVDIIPYKEWLHKLGF